MLSAKSTGRMREGFSAKHNGLPGQKCKQGRTITKNPIYMYFFTLYKEQIYAIIASVKILYRYKIGNAHSFSDNEQHGHYYRRSVFYA